MRIGEEAQPERGRCTGCYDCQRAAGRTPRQRDILGQRHDPSDGRFVIKETRTADAEGRESTETARRPDSTQPTIRLRLLGPVTIR